MIGLSSNCPVDFPADRLRPIFNRLVSLGARYDAFPMYPRDSLSLLIGIGLHRGFAPPCCGGDTFTDARAENAALFQVLRIVGRADLSLGRLFEGHVNALKLFGWYGSDEQLKRLTKDLAVGKLFGVWATEPVPGVGLKTFNQRLCLQGGKTFATGAGGLDYAIITAQPEAGERQLVIVPADSDRRTDLSHWRVRGMRSTGSGSYDLTDMIVDHQDLLGPPGAYDREPRFTGGAWRFTAVQLGGIEGLLTETRTAMPDTARADPLQRAKFADAVVACRTAHMWVRECAMRAADEGDGATDFARLTRGVVERAALDVMELSARIVGTRSAFDGQRIDKISRDLSLYLRQAGPDHAKDRAALAWLDRDVWGAEDELW